MKHIIPLERVAYGLDDGDTGGESEADLLATLASQLRAVEPAELRDGIAQVRSFLSAHGEARFAAWERNEDTRIPVRDRAGYRRQIEGAWEFYITPEAWKGEVCRGYNATTIAAEMVRRGFIQGGTDQVARSLTVPGEGKKRLYCVRARFLEGDDS